jgi:hypothetical protein
MVYLLYLKRASSRQLRHATSFLLGWLASVVFTRYNKGCPCGHAEFESLRSLYNPKPAAVDEFWRL